MYDELVKRLKNNRHPNGLKSQAADAIEQLEQENERLHSDLGKAIRELAKQPRWIPVTERLPKPGKYLVLKTSELAGKPYYYWQIVSYADNLNKVDKYDFPGKEYKRHGWYSYDSEYGHYETGDKITHWMPLPEPPEDGEE